MDKAAYDMALALSGGAIPTEVIYHFIVNDRKDSNAQTDSKDGE
jgi:hypothetical protein